MAHHDIRESDMLTGVDASGPAEAITHYGHVHGWKLKTEKLRELRSGVWALLHGERILFTDDPRDLLASVEAGPPTAGGMSSPP